MTKVGVKCQMINSNHEGTLLYKLMHELKWEKTVPGATYVVQTIVELANPKLWFTS